MANLPVIVGFGGISPAGRSSGLNGYRRLVFESLDLPKRINTLQNLGSLMGRINKDSDGSWLWDKNYGFRSRKMPHGKHPGSSQWDACQKT